MSNTPKVRSNPGGVTESGMIYEQIEKEGTIQYAVKTVQNPNIKLKPHIEMGPHVMYAPLNPSPWLLPNEPQPYETFQELWQEIRQFIYEHLDLENETLYDILVAWIIASWTPERWETAPYLHFFGPSNSGKTRGLDVLNELGYRPMLSPSVSASSIYRALDAYHPTFLLDEFEIYFKMQDTKSEIIGVLNAGYKRGQYVLRTDKVQDGAPILRAFSCFGFKGIGSIQELPRTLQGRAITVPMSKATRKVKRIIDHQKAKELRSKLLFYRFENWNAPAPEGNPIDLPDGRLIELYTPLCLIATKEIEQKILAYANQEYREEIELERGTDEAQVYMAIIEILETEVTLTILQETIRNHINAQLSEKQQWGKQKVRSVLRRLGFKSEIGTRKEGRLKKVIMDSNILERRKNRYVMPEEIKTVDTIIEKLKELQKRALCTLCTLSTEKPPPLNNNKNIIVIPPDNVYNVHSVQNTHQSIREHTSNIIFEHCYFCQQSITTDDWVTDEFTAHKPSHRECYEKQKAMMKKHITQGEDFNPNLYGA